MPHLGGRSGAAANTGRDRSFKQQILSSCWSLEVGWQAGQGWRPEAYLLGVQMAVLPLSSRGHSSSCSCVLIFSACKDTDNAHWIRSLPDNLI